MWLFYEIDCCFVYCELKGFVYIFDVTTSIISSFLMWLYSLKNCITTFTIIIQIRYVEILSFYLSTSIFMCFNIRHYSDCILSCPNIDRVICNSFLFMYRDLLIRTRQRNVAMKVLHELVFHVDREQGFLSRNEFHILCSCWCIVAYIIFCSY